MVMSPLTDCATNYRPVLSSERAPQDEEQSNCPAKERKKKNLFMGPKGVPASKTDRPTDRRSQHQLNSTQAIINNTTLLLKLCSNEDTQTGVSWKRIFKMLSPNANINHILSTFYGRTCLSVVYLMTLPD
jgi:hypothetical protein